MFFTPVTNLPRKFEQLLPNHNIADGFFEMWDKKGVVAPPYPLIMYVSMPIDFLH